MIHSSQSLKALKSSHIFPDADSPPISGYILIHGSQIHSILPLNSPVIPALKSLNYTIFDYENLYIFPGLIDLNVHYNSTYDAGWEDIENIGKMALQGGVTTVLDNPIMNLYGPDFDEKTSIQRRILALKDKIYTDTGLLAYLGPHNLKEIDKLWSENDISGFRLYLARSLMHNLPHFETKDYPELKKAFEGLRTGRNYRFFIHCEAATGRDLFTCSPLRYREKGDRLDLKQDIQDSSKFGGGIQGEMADLDDNSNKSSSSSDSDHDSNISSETEENKDNVGELKNSAGNLQKNEEITSGILRKKADKNAKLQEEQSIARLEIVGYAFNEEEKEVINNYYSSDSELGYVQQSSDSSEDDDISNGNIKKPHKTEIPISTTPKQIIKVESLKQQILMKKVFISGKIGLKNKSFLDNPLIGSLRDALDNLNKDEIDTQPYLSEIKENVESQPNTSDTVRAKTRSPSNLLQRRKMTSSPVQSISPTILNQEPTLADFKIKVNKVTEELNASEKDLKMNQDYQLFLSNHSLSWESNGVNSMITFLSELFLKENSKGTVILSNLSSSNSAFVVRNKAKALNYKLNFFCETSVPFIYFQRNSIKAGQTKFKCSPCIRDKETRNLLIDGLRLQNLIHAVSSFHLQTEKKFKYIEKGNFKRCFNGVSTIGSNLQVVWTKIYCREKKKLENKAKNEKKYAKNVVNLINDEKIFEEILRRLVFLLASSPARIAGLEKKGKIQEGFDADLVVWNPFKIVEMNEKKIYLKEKGLYLFRNQKFYGDVKETWLRGKCVFSKGKFEKTGRILSHIK